MRLLRCDRHPDLQAVATLEIEEWAQLTEAERRESLSPPGTRRYKGKFKVDLCSGCAEELRDFLGDFREKACA